MSISRWRRSAGVGFAGVVLAASLAVGATPAAAEDVEVQRDSSNECAEEVAQAVEGLGDNFEENCFTEAEQAAVEAADESDVLLPNTGDVGSSSNMQLIANVPKTGPFANSTNSDIVFQGNYAFSGNYNGFGIYDIKNPKSPELISQVLCPGSQNDISVYGDLLFLSTDSVRSDDSCESSSGSLANPDHWEGMKIFDISDLQNPEYIKAIRTDCGSHTHTLLPSDDGDSVYIYVSSYNPSATAAYCKPPHDKITIIDVPLDEPTSAEIVSTPVLFPDGGNPGGDPEWARETNGCHDITVYPEMDLAAGACMGDGIIMDISDPVNPVVIEEVRDPNFAFWHSATFNNDASTVIFTDELGGGSSATCNAEIGPERGANAIYSWDGEELTFQSYYKLPRHQASTENCVAHNGSLIPVEGKDIFVQAWYQGGVTVFDFTDPANPTELAWFDRGPVNDQRASFGGGWSTYYYNGHVYTNEIGRGLDVLELRGKEFAPAKRIRMHEFNPQTQPSYRER